MGGDLFHYYIVGGGAYMHGAPGVEEGGLRKGGG
jgi:hypothetical protein